MRILSHSRDVTPGFVRVCRQCCGITEAGAGVVRLMKLVCETAGLLLSCDSLICRLLERQAGL